MGNIYGYIRVSSTDQNEDRQLAALRAKRVQSNRIYMDKQSGKDFNRPKYKRMLKKLKQGDLLYIMSIDRLGRNYKEVLRQWNLLVQQKKVDIQVLDLPLLDTRRRTDPGTAFMADLMLQMLSYMAQAEREAIQKRQAQGIAAAKARGVRFGRPPIEVPEGFETLKTQWRLGKVSARTAAAKLKVSHQTFLRWVKDE